MRTTSIAVMFVAGVTGAALLRSGRMRGALRREAELLGLRAYLSAVDRGGSHNAFIADIRAADGRGDGAWLMRAYGTADEEFADRATPEFVANRQN